MKHSLIIGGLVVSLAGSGVAAPGAAVQYALTFNMPEQMIGMDGVVRILTVTGKVGGIEVTGEYTDADWRVGPHVAPHSTVASGKLSCAKFQCTFSITTLLDQPVSVQGPAFRLGRPVTGPLPGFATRRAWVSAVSRWAQDNLDPGVTDTIVSQAAGVQGGEGH